MKHLILFIILIFTTELFAQDQVIKSFKTDGCSHWQDGPKENPNAWHECCVVHDLKYWAGGTYKQRKQADLGLKQCVESKGYPEMASFMYNAVRITGSPFWFTSYRWGFGWKQGHGYKALDADELMMINNRLDEINDNDLSAIVLKDFFNDLVPNNSH